jgi:hypothetical protein
MYMVLQEEVNALIQSFHARANSLNKKRCSLNERAHWITRGRQRALRRISAQLWTIRKASISSYILYLALQDYLACLEKYAVDVEEEKGTPVIGIYPVKQWKAEGEARELPRIVHLLSRMLQAHTPGIVSHILAMDGKCLVQLGSDEQVYKQAILAPHLSASDATGLLAGSRKASDQEPTLSPIRRRTLILRLNSSPSCLERGERHV